MREYVGMLGMRLKNGRNSWQMRWHDGKSTIGRPHFHICKLFDKGLLIEGAKGRSNPALAISLTPPLRNHLGSHSWRHLATYKG